MRTIVSRVLFFMGLPSFLSRSFFWIRDEDAPRVDTLGEENAALTGWRPGISGRVDSRYSLRGAFNLSRGTFDRARGTFILLPGTLDLSPGILDPARGALQPVRGALQLTRGMLDLAPGTFDLLHGALQLPCGTLDLSRGTFRGRGMSQVGHVLRNRRIGH
jgi:hypothetical protein